MCMMGEEAMPREQQVPRPIGMNELNTLREQAIWLENKKQGGEDRNLGMHQAMM